MNDTIIHIVNSVIDLGVRSAFIINFQVVSTLPNTHEIGKWKAQVQCLQVSFPLSLSFLFCRIIVVMLPALSAFQVSCEDDTCVRAMNHCKKCEPLLSIVIYVVFLGSLFRVTQDVNQWFNRDWSMLNPNH